MRQALITAGLLVPLGLDTFALAAALGLAGLTGRDRLRVALVFTAFEAGMPILGVVVGRVAGGFLGQWAGYAGIAFLFVAGAPPPGPSAPADDAEPRLEVLTPARG